MSRRQTRNSSAMAETSALLQSSISNSSYTSSAMYMNSQFNHPAFNKLYIGAHNSTNGKTGHTTTASGNAVPKAPKAPEKPLMPYMRYSRKIWDEVKATQPDLKLWEIGKIIGKMWRELPAGDKQSYVDDYEAEKIEYQEALKSYHNSPAYQVYLQAKGRAEMLESTESRMEREESYMSIEPADDDNGDTDEGFTVKHIAAARFQRNHRLMQDILQDPSVIPSGRNIVTQKRLNTLREQVQSLEHHQDKLKKELQLIEKNHCGTKRKWKEQADKFKQEMKRLRSMTPQEYYQEYKKLHAQKKAEAAAAAAAAAAKEAEKKKAQEAEAAKAKASAENGETPAADASDSKPSSEDAASKDTSNGAEKTPLLQKELSTDAMETDAPSADADKKKETEDKTADKKDETADSKKKEADPKEAASDTKASS